MIEPVGTNGWQDRVLLARLQGHNPDARQLTAVEPVGAELDEVDAVTFHYVDRNGEPSTAVATGDNLADLVRFYDDADYPLQA